MRKRIITWTVAIFLCVVVGFGIVGCQAGKDESVSQSELDTAGFDLLDSNYAVYQADQGDMSAEEFEEKLNTTVSVLQKRLEKRGYNDATVVIQGSDSIRVDIPDKQKDVTALFEAICKPAKLEIKDINGNVQITGDMVVSAAAMYSMDSNEPIVELTLNAEGGKIFGDISAEAYTKKGSTLDIVIDGQTISSPEVRDGPIYGGIAIISGGGPGFTIEEAQQLVMNIQSGMLPLHLDIIEKHAINVSQ